MFCALMNYHSNTDHIVLQISSLQLKDVEILKNGKAVQLPNCQYSIVISGGFEPGVYTITSKKHAEFFVFKKGKNLHSGVINNTLTIEIDRHNYKLL